MNTNNFMENKTEGWISIYRSIKHNWIWKNPVKLKWWLDLLLSARADAKPYKINIGNKIIECKRGQIVFSLHTLSINWLTTPKTVKTFLELLQRDNMITVENLKITTRITICNYDSYQQTVNIKETDGKHIVNGKETDGKHMLPTNNNDNNENNENNVNNENKQNANFSKNFFSIAEMKFRLNYNTEQIQTYVLQNISYFTKQGFKPDELPYLNEAIETAFKNEMFEELKNSASWQENTAMQNKISTIQLEAYLIEFIKLKFNTECYKGLVEFKKYFTNWLNILLKK